MIGSYTISDKSEGSSSLLKDIHMKVVRFRPKEFLCGVETSRATAYHGYFVAGQEPT